MIVVRYATLVALVVWLGAMMGEQFGDLLRRVHLVTYACGAATVVGLFVMKFMGPPPRAFAVRAAIAVVMLALTLGSTLLVTRDVSAALMIVNIGLGLVLLNWYVRE
jgi:uncharacterized membrane protein YwaF